jgi:REP element-mobilizing transposase RayT
MFKGGFMARIPRVSAADKIHHVMNQGGYNNGNRKLYRNNKDKYAFLDIVREAKEKFIFKVYAFCVMDTHYHILIDPLGSSISAIMKNINQRYASYYNRKYKKKGYVFGKRFKNIVVESDSQIIQNLRYIHNNTKALPEFKNIPEDYPFSSFGIFMNRIEDEFNILDKDFPLSLFTSENKVLEMYEDLMIYIKEDVNFKINKDSKIYFDKFNGYVYSCERKILWRYLSFDNLANTIKTALGEEVCIAQHIKRDRNFTKFRSLLSYCLCTFGNFTLKQISHKFGNLTPSGARYLSTLGKKYFIEDKFYLSLMHNLQTENN